MLLEGEQRMPHSMCMIDLVIASLPATQTFKQDTKEWKRIRGEKMRGKRGRKGSRNARNASSGLGLRFSFLPKEWRKKSRTIDSQIFADDSHSRNDRASPTRNVWCKSISNFDFALISELDALAIGIEVLDDPELFNFLNQ